MRHSDKTGGKGPFHFLSSTRIRLLALVLLCHAYPISLGQTVPQSPFPHNDVKLAQKAPQHERASRSSTDHRFTHARIKLILSEFESSKTQKPTNQLQGKRVQPTPLDQPTIRLKRHLKHFLKARLDRPNHFYFDSYHVIAEPMMYFAEAQKAVFKLTFFHRHGDYKQLEESLGYVKLSAKLTGHTQVAETVGYTQKVFRNHLSKPSLRVVLGQKPVKPNFQRPKPITPLAASSQSKK